jgi:hypothetical protein
MTYKDPQKRKEYQKNYVKQHYLDNKEIYKQRAKESNKRYVQWFKEIKNSLVCTKCGENRPACIEFHHPEHSKKETTVATMIRKQWSRKRVLEEIAKCEILCSNCHKDFHWSQFFE